jgi:hypothetical protein
MTNFLHEENFRQANLIGPNLPGSLSATSTTMRVTAGAGTNIFPNVPFALTLAAGTSQVALMNSERVKVIAKEGGDLDLFHIIRNFDNDKVARPTGTLNGLHSASATTIAVAGFTHIVDGNQLNIDGHTYDYVIVSHSPEPNPTTMTIYPGLQYETADLTVLTAVVPNSGTGEARVHAAGETVGLWVCAAYFKELQFAINTLETNPFPPDMVGDTLTLVNHIQLGPIKSPEFTPTAGMIQWAGGHFQGYTGVGWVNLDEGGGAGWTPPAGTDGQIMYWDPASAEMYKWSATGAILIDLALPDTSVKIVLGTTEWIFTEALTTLPTALQTGAINADSVSSASGIFDYIAAESGSFLDVNTELTRAGKQVAVCYDLTGALFGVATGLVASFNDLDLGVGSAIDYVDLMTIVGSSVTIAAKDSINLYSPTGAGVSMTLGSLDFNGTEFYIYTADRIGFGLHTLFVPLASYPVTPEEGMFFFHDSDGFRVYQAGGWHSVIPLSISDWPVPGVAWASIRYNPDDDAAEWTDILTLKDEGAYMKYALVVGPRNLSMPEYPGMIEYRNKDIMGIVEDAEGHPIEVSLTNVSPSQRFPVGMDQGLLNGGHSSGVVTLQVKGLTASVTDGETLQFQNHDQVYTIQSHLPATGPTVTIVISPGLVQAMNDESPFATRWGRTLYFGTDYLWHSTRASMIVDNTESAEPTQILRVSRIQVGDSGVIPNGYAGTIKWDSDTNQLLWHNGTSWNAWPIEAAVPLPTTPGAYLIVEEPTPGVYAWAESDAWHLDPAEFQADRPIRTESIILDDHIHDPLILTPTGFTFPAIDTTSITTNLLYVQGSGSEAHIDTLWVTTLHVVNEDEEESLLTGSRLDLIANVVDADTFSMIATKSSLDYVSLGTNIALLGRVNHVGGYAIGDDEIDVDTFTESVVVGNYIRFVGDTHYYRILSKTPPTGATTHIKIFPILYQTLADDTECYTNSANFANFFIADRNSFRFDIPVIIHDLSVTGQGVFTYTLQVGAEEPGVTEAPGMIRFNGDFQGCLEPGVWASFTRTLAEGDYNGGLAIGTILWWNGTQWVKNTNLYAGINGSLVLGIDLTPPATAGAVRFTGTDFQGYNGSTWVSFTGYGGSPSLPSGIGYDGATLRWDDIGSQWRVNPNLTSNGVKTIAALMQLGDYSRFISTGQINHVGGYGIGATELDVDTFIGPVLDDSTIVIAGDVTVQTITAHSPVVGPTTHITVTPGLSAAVLDNAVITVTDSLPIQEVLGGQIRYNQNDYEGFVEGVGWASFTGHRSWLPTLEGDPLLRTGQPLVFGGTNWVANHYAIFRPTGLELQSDLYVDKGLWVDGNTRVQGIILGDKLTKALVDLSESGGSLIEMPEYPEFYDVPVEGQINHVGGYSAGDSVLDVDGFTTELRDGAQITINGTIIREIASHSPGSGSTTQITIVGTLGAAVPDDATIVVTGRYIAGVTTRIKVDTVTWTGPIAVDGQVQIGSGTLYTITALTPPVGTPQYIDFTPVLVDDLEPGEAVAGAGTALMPVPIEGMLYYDTNSKAFWGYDSVAWRAMLSPIQGTPYANQILRFSELSGYWEPAVVGPDSLVKVEDDVFVSLNPILIEGDGYTGWQLEPIITEDAPVRRGFVLRGLGVPDVTLPDVLDVPDVWIAAITGSPEHATPHVLLNTPLTVVNSLIGTELNIDGITNLVGNVTIGSISEDVETWLYGALRLKTGSMYLVAGDIVLRQGSLYAANHIFGYDIRVDSTGYFGTWVRVGYSEGNSAPIGAIRYSTPGNVTRGDWEGWDGENWISFTAGFHGQAIWGAATQGQIAFYDATYEGGKWRGTSSFTISGSTVQAHLPLVLWQDMQMQPYAAPLSIGSIRFTGTDFEASIDGASWLSLTAGGVAGLPDGSIGSSLYWYYKREEPAVDTLTVLAEAIDGANYVDVETTGDVPVETNIVMFMSDPQEYAITAVYPITGDQYRVYINPVLQEHVYISDTGSLYTSVGTWQPYVGLSCSIQQTKIMNVLTLNAYENILAYNRPSVVGGQLRYNQNDFEGFVEGAGWVSLTGMKFWADPIAHQGEFLISNGSAWYASDTLLKFNATNTILTLLGSCILDVYETDFTIMNTIYMNATAANADKLELNPLSSSPSVPADGTLYFGADFKLRLRYNAAWNDVLVHNNDFSGKSGIIFNDSTNTLQSANSTDYPNGYAVISESETAPYFYEGSAVLSRPLVINQETLRAEKFNVGDPDIYWVLHPYIQSGVNDYFEIRREAESLLMLNYQTKRCTLTDTFTLYIRKDAEILEDLTVGGVTTLTGDVGIGAFVDIIALTGIINAKTLSVSTNILAPSALIQSTLYGGSTTAFDIQSIGCVGIGSDSISGYSFGDVRYTGAVIGFVDGEHLVGATTINVKAFTGIIKVGSKIRFNSSGQSNYIYEYTVTGNDGGDPTTQITISPGLVVLTPDNASAVVWNKGDWEGWDGEHWISFTHVCGGGNVIYGFAVDGDTAWYNGDTDRWENNNTLQVFHDLSEIDVNGSLSITNGLTLDSIAGATITINSGTHSGAVYGLALLTGQLGSSDSHVFGSSILEIHANALAFGHSINNLISDTSYARGFAIGTITATLGSAYGISIATISGSTDTYGSWFGAITSATTNAYGSYIGTVTASSGISYGLYINSADYGIWINSGESWLGGHTTIVDGLEVDTNPATGYSILLTSIGGATNYRIINVETAAAPSGYIDVLNTGSITANTDATVIRILGLTATTGTAVAWNMGSIVGATSAFGLTFSGITASTVTAIRVLTITASATTAYGLAIPTISGVTETALITSNTLSASGGIANGLYIGKIDASTEAAAINVPEIEGDTKAYGMRFDLIECLGTGEYHTSYGLYIASITAASDNILSAAKGIYVASMVGQSYTYGIQFVTIDAKSRDAYGLNFGSILANTTSGQNAYGLAITTITGGTTAYGIKLGTITSTTSDSVGIEVGTVVGPSGQAYGIRINSISTNGYSIYCNDSDARLFNYYYLRSYTGYEARDVAGTGYAQVVGQQRAGITDAAVPYPTMPGNYSTAQTQIDANNSHLQGKINAIIAALEAHGLIATV